MEGERSMTSASAAYIVSRMMEIAGVEGPDRYVGDGGGGVGFGCLCGSLGGTGGGVLPSLRRREDVVFSGRSGKGGTSVSEDA